MDFARNARVESYDDKYLSLRSKAIFVAVESTSRYFSYREANLIACTPDSENE